jgi:two-component system, OmpR family, response regulator MtrA
MSKLLLVEDDSGISTPLSLYLESAGYEVTLCADGSQAEDVYNRDKHAIIILDINLPGKT